MAESCFVHLAADLLREGYSVRFQAKGASMYPTIDDGEEIVVEPVAPSAVKVGDVLLYRAQRRIIAHRVVQMARTEGRGRNYSFILQGDALDSCDAPVEASQILGRVTCVQRGGRTVELERCVPTRVSGVRLCAVRLRWAIGSQLSGFANFLRIGPAPYSGRR
ncbi:MAG: hypothetical protein HYY11_08685 [Candidatus Methylomirabilis oxyfera]|nr:hypothetical protein [Candidatus Methylomirabilis oxyfera]